MHLPLAPLNPDDFRKLIPTRGQLEQMTSDDLRSILDLSGALSDHILNMAADAWRILDSRGVDLSPYLEHDKYRRVRDIAEGKIAAELVMRFGTDTRVLRKASRLPVEVQKKLAADDRVELVVKDAGSGELTTRKVHFLDLDKNQLEQVIAEKGVAASELRTVNQQIAYLSPSPAQHPEGGAAPARVHIVRGKLRTDGEVPVEAVIRALRAKGFLSVTT